MKKQKRWQFILIAVVVLLTFYNILPTVLFYSKPLKDPIEEKQAMVVAENAVKRINLLEDEALNWLKSYNKLLGIKPSSISLDSDNSALIHVRYEKGQDAEKLRNHIPRAGSLIPFVPAKLSLIPSEKDNEATVVTIQRNIPIHFYPDQIEKTFQFTAKRNAEGNITPLYRQIVDDRILQIGLAVGGISENAQYLETTLHHLGNPQSRRISTDSFTKYSDLFESIWRKLSDC